MASIAKCQRNYALMEIIVAGCYVTAIENKYFLSTLNVLRSIRFLHCVGINKARYFDVGHS